MSVYVNMGLITNDENNERCILESRTKGQDILRNPSNFSVGINRFKLPLMNIPMFRVYNGDYHFGLIIRAPTYVRSAPILGIDQARYKRVNDSDMGKCFFGMNDFKNPHSANTDNQVFNNTGMPNWGVDAKRDNTFRDFHSQEDFIDFMNLGLLRAFAYATEKDTEFTSTTVSNGGNISTNNNAGTIATNLTNVVVAPGNAVKQYSGRVDLCSLAVNKADDLVDRIANNHTFISSLEIKLTGLQMNSDAGGQPSDLSHYSLWIARIPIDKTGQDASTSAESQTRLDLDDYDRWCIMKNCFEGVQEDFQNGAIENSILFTTKQGITTVRENKNGRNFRRFVAVKNGAGVSADYRVALDYIVAKDIVGKRADGYKYMLYLVNDIDYSKRTGTTLNQTPYFTIPAGNAEMTLNTCSLSDVRDVESYSGRTTGGVFSLPSEDPSGLGDINHKLPPYFSYDNSTNKVQYNISNDFLISKTFDLYMNNHLYDQFSFNRYAVDDVDGGSTFNVYFFDNGSIGGLDFLGPNSNFKGKILTFPSSIGDTGVGRDEKADWYEMNRYDEEEDSRFKREQLSSILITSPNLAVNGEIVGDGAQTRKIISDFAIDPATQARDYLVYEGGASSRLYSLYATTPLKDFTVEVFRQDTDGTIRPLKLNKFQEANLKLEFRPNSIVYSQLQDVSVFDI